MNFAKRMAPSAIKVSDNRGGGGALPAKKANPIPLARMGAGLLVEFSLYPFFEIKSNFLFNELPLGGFEGISVGRASTNSS